MFHSLDCSEIFTELYREEKREEGDRGGQENKGGNQKCAPANPQLHRRPSNTKQVVLIQFSWDHFSFPLSIDAHKIVFLLQDWSLCFPQSCGSPIIKSWWSSRSDSLGLPIEQTENQGTLPGGVASASVEIQTVPIVVEDLKNT